MISLLDNKAFRKTRVDYDRRDGTANPKRNQARFVREKSRREHTSIGLMETIDNERRVHYK